MIVLIQFYKAAHTSVRRLGLNHSKNESNSVGIGTASGGRLAPQPQQAGGDGHGSQPLQHRSHDPPTQRHHLTTLTPTDSLPARMSTAEFGPHASAATTNPPRPH